MSPEKRFDTLVNFWGYGNPDTARIVFIGIEEGSDWSQYEISKTSEERKKRIENGDPSEFKKVVDEMIEFRKGNYLKREDWVKDNERWREREPKRTEKMQCLISQKIREEVLLNHTVIDHVQYYKNSFGEKYEFQANLFPIAFKVVSDKGTKETHELFGINENKEEYYENCLSKRLEVLKKFLNLISENSGTPWVFFMGKGDIWNNKKRWDAICNILFPKLHFVFDNKGPNESRYGWSNDGKIWSVVHPNGANGLKIIEIEKIINIILEIQQGNLKG